jgi:hypothetical protein
MRVAIFMDSRLRGNDAGDWSNTLSTGVIPAEAGSQAPRSDE